MTAWIMLKWPQSRKIGQKIRNVIFEIETAEEIHDLLYRLKSSFAVKSTESNVIKKIIFKCSGTDY